MQSHGGSPHTPDHCDIPLRSVQELEDCYNENLSDNRGSGNFHPNLNLNKTGRHHSSVSRRNLFPFVCLDNIVPPVLHITLGIVLKLFNLLLSKCRVLDGVDSKALNHIEKKWEKKSKEMEKKEEQCRAVGRSYLDLRNLQERLQALFDDNAAEIDFIARQSEFSVKKKQSNEKCKNMSCIISGFDDRISWIQCDSCKLWFHMLCEGVVTSDFSKISAVRLYKCLCCRKIVSNLDEMIPFITSTLDALRDNQAIVEQQFHSLGDECLFFLGSKLRPW